MARYTINYLTGDTETIEADRSEYDLDSRSLCLYTNEQPVAWIPQANVRSVIREDDEAEQGKAITYPHSDGDVTVLGPEVFASADGEAISWRGENYTRNPRNLFGKATA